MDLFILLTLASVVAILLLGAYRWITGKKGSWNSHIVDPEVLKAPAATPRSPTVSKGEQRARDYLEKRFAKLFTKCRPSFLMNKVTSVDGKTYNMELDCYNDELKLGVEYNGRQHYEYTPYFHASKETFYNQKYRDELKRIYCKENGVVMIEIPHTEDARLESFLEAKLLEAGF